MARYTSRIPAIVLGLEARMDLIARAGAELTEQGARDRVPVLTGKLRDRIHVEHEGPGEYAVIAGDREVFYGHIVEHGGIHAPAHPFMTPAAQSARAAMPKLGAQILGGL